MSIIPRRRDLILLFHQVRYEQLSFWRNPQSAFFTFAFPVVIIAIFGAMFRGDGPSSYFYGRSALEYYVPTIAAASVLGSCYSQLAIVLAIRRQDGILKRVRATPLPAGTYFLGLLAHCVMVSVMDILLIVGVGRVFGVAFPTRWLEIAAALVLAAARRRGGLADPQRRGRARGGAARPVPAGVHLRHVRPDSLRHAEPHLRRAAGPAVQRDPARLLRRARRARLEEPGRAARLGRGRGAGRRRPLPLDRATRAIRSRARRRWTSSPASTSVSRPEPAGAKLSP